jgi:hypothetical protein
VVKAKKIIGQFCIYCLTKMLTRDPEHSLSILSSKIVWNFYGNIWNQCIEN